MSTASSSLPAPPPSNYSTYTQANPRLGDKVADFAAETTQGPIKLYEYQGESWLLLFSHPADFTPVCTTELGRVASLASSGEWEKRKVKVLALSCDTVEKHQGWIKDIEETQSVKLNYPIIADPTRGVACQFGMLDQFYVDKAGMPATVRSVFLLDPGHHVRFIITYPASTGRNFDEILRVIDSIQLTHNYKVATPADWKKGGETVILPTIPTEEACKMFKNVTIVKPYLRLTPDPSVHQS